ncbi:MAG: ABC transporter ATP-binding protein [Oligoflexia bacterium]|nr:ABC transporter ATP-binding protein [Oligoflexia bacterium]
MSLLSIKNLSVEFKTKELYVKALKEVSFEVKKGEALGVVGESGSGKSVTALSIMRLLPQPPGEITGGEIFFHKKDLLKNSERQMREVRGNQISMIFQEPMTSLNPVFTVGYQIDEALILHQKMNKKEAREKTIDLLDQVGIADPKGRVNAYPHEMSGGQRQRVMIAMAIACKPELLIADEPTTALDVTIQKQIIELLKNLQEKMDMSILFISHDLGVIAKISQRVLVMQGGKIVEEGLTSDIFKKPQKAYTKGLIACRPHLDIKTSRLPMVIDFLADKQSDLKQLPLKQKKTAVFRDFTAS